MIQPVSFAGSTSGDAPILFIDSLIAVTREGESVVIAYAQVTIQVLVNDVNHAERHVESPNTYREMFGVMEFKGFDLRDRAVASKKKELHGSPLANNWR
jgi:hypothetical protein